MLGRRHGLGILPMRRIVSGTPMAIAPPVHGAGDRRAADQPAPLGEQVRPIGHQTQRRSLRTTLALSPRACSIQVTVLPAYPASTHRCARQG
jgi:hypothetical protein